MSKNIHGLGGMGCCCPLPHSTNADYTNCTEALRSLAEECAKTEEQLNTQLESLKAQLESKDRIRGKNLIPTVLHRLREYMEMTKKIHRY